MLIYTEMEYQDIDGNRGVQQTYVEIEPSDADEIREQIKVQYDPDVTTYTIYMYDHFDGEHEFEVDINDYFTYAEVKEL